MLTTHSWLVRWWSHLWGTLDWQNQETQDIVENPFFPPVFSSLSYRCACNYKHASDTHHQTYKAETPLCPHPPADFSPCEDGGNVCLMCRIRKKRLFCRFIFLEHIPKSKDSNTTLITCDMTPILFPPYPVSPRGLVHLMGLVFHYLTMEPLPAIYNHSRQPGWWMWTLSWWQTNHLSWIAVVVGYFLLQSWCVSGAGEQLGASGKMGKKMYNFHNWAVFKMNSLCLGFGSLLLYFLCFIFNWWNSVGWHGKHLLDNQHCIHRKLTE